MMRPALFLTLLLALVAPVGRGAAAEPGTLCSTGKWGHVMCIRPSHVVHDTCQAIGHFAGLNGLDPGFFARLIWQESRFDPNALSPADARGIAQFIDTTAHLRGLRDSYNPAAALEHSAEYLGELTRRFGNPGLAAVAYNGGEARAEAHVAGSGGLPAETEDYVRIITGLDARTWRDDPPADPDFRLDAARGFAASCHDLARTRRLSRLPPLAPDHAPFGVQVAYGLSEQAARRAFDQRTRACRSEVAAAPLDLVRVRNRVSGRRAFVMARLGQETATEAHALCERLRARGCICAVYRNP